MALLTDFVEHDAQQALRCPGGRASRKDGDPARCAAALDGKSTMAGSMVNVSAEISPSGSEAAIATQVDRRVRRRVADLQAAHDTFDTLSCCFENDLRTPMRAIEGLSDLMAERVGRLDPDCGAAAATVRAASQALAQALNALIESSRLATCERQPGHAEPAVQARAVARNADEQGVIRSRRRARMLRELHICSRGGLLILAAGLFLVVVCEALF